MTAKVLHIDRQAIKIAVGDSTGAKTNSTGVGKMNVYKADQVTTGSNRTSEHYNIEQLCTGNVLILTRTFSTGSWTAEDSYYDDNEGDFEYMEILPADVNSIMGWPTFEAMVSDLSSRGFEMPTLLASLVDGTRFTA